jgi:methylated-DNA-[protein]-cysteine S-methyltransferase
MPVVTTAENPLMALLVQRARAPHRPYPDIDVDLSEYGRIPPPDGDQACPVHDASPLRSFDSVATPLGAVLVVFSGDELVGLHFDGHARTPPRSGRNGGPASPMRALSDQLDEYFSGERTRFDVALRFEGTPFQIAVWSALIEIPFGQTSTYSHLAERIGRTRAARAVGTANGQNPISIVVPCHRLIGASGDLTGYGWGLDRKRSLLELEGAIALWSRPVRRARAGA